MCQQSSSSIKNNNQGHRAVRDGAVSPAAGGLFLGPYRGTVWDGNGAGRWDAIWLTGPDGSTRLLGGMGRERTGERVGEIGRTHSREIGPENSREIGGECGREHGRGYGRESLAWFCLSRGSRPAGTIHLHNSQACHVLRVRRGCVCFWFL